jgi:ribulose kinase
MISGLSLDQGVDSICTLYLSVMASIAYGTRHIVDVLRDSGFHFDRIAFTGGLCQNSVFVQLHADATGLPILLSGADQAVALGSATTAATALMSPDNLAFQVNWMHIELWITNI